MRINLVDDIEKVQNRGDVWAFHNEEKGCMQLVMVCPECGEISASAGSHKWDPETLTYTPSIVHSKELGGCGWHGYIKNGEFTNA